VSRSSHAVIPHLARLVAGTTYESLGPDTVDAAKRLVLDSLGCALATIGQPTARALLGVVDGVSSTRPCSVVGEPGRRLPAELAAFVNGTLVRYLDYNDTYVSSSRVGHPSDYIPAALGAGEEVGADGRRVLAAVVSSYEVFCRLLEAIPVGTDRFDHVVYGAAAAAAAAGSCWGLTEQELEEALALAIAPNVPLQATRVGSLSTWKGCASANACRNGIFAARLARHGITGPADPVEGHGGLCSAMHSTVDQIGLSRPGRPAAVLESHLKRYPVGFLAQTAIDAAIALHERLAVDDPIRGVEIRTFRYAITAMAGEKEKWDPSTRETADHSLPFLIASALVRGSIDLATFAEDGLADPTVRALLPAISVVDDERYNRAWPEATPYQITVTLAGGSTLIEEASYHLGHQRRPLSDDQLTAKFRELAEPVLGLGRASAVIEAVFDLERLGPVELLARTVS
jgi:2-methylcitrate dehydratase